MVAALTTKSRPPNNPSVFAMTRPHLVRLGICPPQDDSQWRGGWPQSNVILEAVDERMDKKLNEKFDHVMTKLDGIMKGVEALQQENTVGAEQLRRHADQLQSHEARIAKLETVSA